MIVEWLVGLATSVAGWIADLFGEWTPPPELTGMVDGVRDFLAGMVGLGVWINWPVLAGCVAVAVTAWSSVLVIKLARAVAAHIPLFGGAGD